MSPIVPSLASLSRLLVLLLLLGFKGVRAQKQNGDDFKVTVTPSGDYSVHVRNETWLSSAATFCNVGGKMYSAADGSLKLNGTDTVVGKDVHGAWSSSVFHYIAGTTPFHVAFKVYKDVPMVVFEQYFPDGASDTSVGNPNRVLSGFPHFNVGGQMVDLGYLHYGGMMVGDTTKWMDRWTNNTINLRDGVPGGPLTLFDKQGHTLVISAYSQFMAASIQHHSFIGGTISWGIMGSVTQIPALYSYATVLYYCADGINEGYENWGESLRKEYGRSDSFARVDFAVNYLGYWMDNGSYYYYNPEQNKTFEDTVLDVQQYANSMGIPYRYVQYDSWWYFKGLMDGVTAWEGMPDVFPNGMAWLYNKTGWPVVAHNRWWSAWTPYAKQNGGKFDFIVDGFKSVPTDESFWDYLFKLSRSWGLITYEQDWMDVQSLAIGTLKTDVYAARQWLMLMGKAAAKNDLTVQYCMSHSRHALQALEIQAVTQARVSDDYSPGKSNWKIGISSIFAHALRLSPYKDTFWTTCDQPGSIYGLNEKWPALHAVTATLSTGPVGPGDEIGKTNVSLLLRCCNMDGLILKPSRPVTAIDLQIMESAFHNGMGPVGEVWTTFSEVSGYKFGIILAAEMENATFKLTPAAAGFRSLQKSKVFMDNPHTLKAAQPFDSQHPLVLEGCSNLDFCLYHTVPVMLIGDKELLLYGEISKWVPMSAKRFSGIQISDDDVTVHVTGAVGEEVEVWFSLDGRALSAKCTLSESGTAFVSIQKQRCFSI